jgi:hypothetical protein
MCAEITPHGSNHIRKMSVSQWNLYAVLRRQVTVMQNVILVSYYQSEFTVLIKNLKLLVLTSYIICLQQSGFCLGLIIMVLGLLLVR